MTLLYSDLRFLEHQTGMHPEQPGRLGPVVAHLTENWLAAQCGRPEFEPCHRQRLALVHSPGYIDELWAFARSGGGDIDPDTVVCPASYDVARLAAGAVCDAVCRVVAGEDTTALCLVRPPGHHALADRAMGFCLFNNVAVAAAMALEELGLDRLLIVDFDVHHGNGTQAAFWTDPRGVPFDPPLALLSRQRRRRRAGRGRGLGSTLNLPIAFGTRRREYLALFRLRLAEFADRIRPQLVLVSAGFDAHRQDPLGHLGLEAEDYATITEAILEAAAAHAGGRVVSTLEGGYNPPVLAQCVAEHLLCLVDHGRKA